ncbi:lactate utilization protein C [Alkalihalobacillus sp. AL-G]|uniref:LutC/YkgG family protein n=1 Tax=Alkalihalobacillus sp. AL-G TaxID=2926399 RepID=UPI00272D4008|nr:lactate utilization protein C [Alkalihalobacillus sp. AL-G]WLD94406.1 lactate utilization protein C [Alkalihalobacillus sp. AL-G]
MKGTIQKRETFLDNVAEQLGRNRRTEGVKRPHWKTQPQWNVMADNTKDELVEVFKVQCEAIHTDFIQTKKEELGDTVSNVIRNYNGGSVITSKDPRFLGFGLWSEFNKLQRKQSISFHEWDPSIGEENIRIAEKANVGITFSDITLAESGTVVLFSDNGKGRSVSLLPSTYIAIIPKSTIVPRLSQATKEIHEHIEKGKDVASCVNFISGPSNSADIEMNLVVGVHGPIKATYIVVEDC